MKITSRMALRTLLLATLAVVGCAKAVGTATDDQGVPCDGPGCPDSCSSDADCKGGFKCDPKSGLCVFCYEDKHCQDGELCKQDTHLCARGCNPNKSCGDAGRCELDAGACVECLHDNECHDPMRPRCDPLQDKCFPCLPAQDNCGKGLFCLQQGLNYSCVAGCKDDSDCGGGMAMDAKCDKAQHKCVQCLLDTECPLGQVCHSGLCVSGCSNVQKCNNMLTCCKMLCVDTTTDYQNCGQCGAACQNGFNCCNAACSNPANDVMNCGGCGLSCKSPNGVAGCKLRQCVIASCNPGWADCNGVFMDGCETNTDTNVGNCGGCNNPCSLANASPKCVAGKCQVAACSLGFGDCNMLPGDGCETNIFSDVANCGGCAKPCAIPHATPKCQGGACAIGACDAGYADCNNNVLDGCEINLTADDQNCGMCGKICPNNNGNPACQNSVCTIGCNQNFADCNNNPNDGCETDLQNDPQHCGGCQLNCNNLPQHVSQAGCSGGNCDIAQCQNGYFDLINGWNDGCECQGDGAGNVCNAPTGVGALAPGQSTTVTGNIVPLMNENWYQVTYTGNTNPAYHPRVAITTNPNNAFRIDIRSNCAGGIQNCAVEGGVSNGRTVWETFYTMGDPNSAFNPIPAVGTGGTIFIRVHRVQGGVTCDSFVLSISN